MAVSEAVLDAVRAGMRGLQPPKHFDKVYKDECMFSFDTPESPGGLFVNLKTYQVQQTLVQQTSTCSRSAQAGAYSCACGMHGYDGMQFE